MKRSIIFISFIFLVTTTAYPWGFWGHQRINRMAVLVLPSEMIGLFKNNIDFISQHAVDADKRRYSVKEEAPRHFIDLDNYGTPPFKNLPRTWKEASIKFSEDTLLTHGIVPWHIEKTFYALTAAFKERNKKKILRLAADLGHYIADAHVPLHTTKNYNGQLTNQLGIHAFWESRLPELFGEDYNYFVGKAVFVEKPLDKIWEIIYQSHSLVDSVFNIEKELRTSFPPDEQYAFEKQGARTVRVASESFSKSYNENLNGMVEKRMQGAIVNVASFWLTAWVNAGQPNLTKLKDEKITEEDKKTRDEEDKKFKEGSILGREE